MGGASFPWRWSLSYDAGSCGLRPSSVLGEDAVDAWVFVGGWALVLISLVDESDDVTSTSLLFLSMMKKVFGRSENICDVADAVGG